MDAEENNKDTNTDNDNNRKKTKNYQYSKNLKQTSSPVATPDANGRRKHNTNTNRQDKK